MLERRHVRYFIAVAEELNFSRAAERLHMAQPPLSVAIRKLELDLGTELLVRNTREVSLTAAGKAFLQGAYKVDEELERTISATRRSGAAEARSVRISYCCATQIDTLPALAAAFGEAFPEVELVTEEMWNSDASVALRSGRIDIAIGVCPEVGPDVRSERVRNEPIVALLPGCHPLAQETEVDLRELRRGVFYFLPREVAPRLHDTLLGLCRRSGFEPTVRYGGMGQPWELEALVDLGLVTLLPESVTTGVPAGVAVVPLGEPSDRLEIGMSSRADDSSLAVAAFRGVASTLFPDAIQTRPV